MSTESCSCDEAHEPECEDKNYPDCSVCDKHPGKGHPCGWLMPLEEGEIYECGRESPPGQVHCGGEAHDYTCDLGRGTEHHCTRRAVATILKPLNPRYGGRERHHRTCQEHAPRWATRSMLAYPQDRAFSDHWIVWDRIPRVVGNIAEAYAVYPVDPKDAAFKCLIKETHGEATRTARMFTFPTRIEALYRVETGIA